MSKIEELRARLSAEIKAEMDRYNDDRMVNQLLVETLVYCNKALLLPLPQEAKEEYLKCKIQQIIEDKETEINYSSIISSKYQMRDLEMLRWFVDDYFNIETRHM